MRILSPLQTCLLMLWICLLSGTSFPQIPLSGEITGAIKKLDYPYLVEKDIIIPIGKQCTIEAGTIFLFKAYSGIKVYGTIEVNGTDSQPVVFTSALDRTFNRDTSRITDATPVAAAFDWNGMDILDQAQKCTITNASFWYMVNGIYSRNTEITIDKCYFNFTGNIDVRIGDKPYTVTPGTSFSFHPQVAPIAPSIKPNPIPVARQQPWHKRMNKEIRFGCIGISALGLAAGAVFGTLAWVDYNQLSRMNSEFKDESTSRVTTDQIDGRENRYRSNVTGMVAGVSAGTLGALGFLLTLDLKK